MGSPALPERDLAVLRSFARRIDPSDAGAHNNLGVLYYQKGLIPEAVAEFSRALELDPRMQVAQANLEITYLQEFDAQIISVNAESPAVILDQTAFYPGGGGQPCDFGPLTVNGFTYSVYKVKKQGDDVLHFLAGDAPLPTPNSALRGTLDWARRYNLMRTHTALHVLCGTVFRDYGALVTGGDMEPLKGRMDFEFETMRGDLVREIEAAVNKEVAQARDVRVKILPREEAFQIPDLIRTKINLLPEGIQQVRTVEIVGLDLQADGGTHVRNTSEVGAIRVADYKSKGAINKRIYIEVE